MTTTTNGQAAADVLEQLLGIDDIAVSRLPVKAWGGKVVFLRPLMSCDLEAFEEWAKENAGLGMAKAKYASLHLVTEDGTPLPFTEAKVHDLAKKHAGAIEEIVDFCWALDGRDKASAEETEGNSEATPSDDSG